MTKLLIPFVNARFVPETKDGTFSTIVGLPRKAPLRHATSTINGLRSLVRAVSRSSLYAVCDRIKSNDNSRGSVFRKRGATIVGIVLSPSYPIPPRRIVTRFMRTARSARKLRIALGRRRGSLDSLLKDRKTPVIIRMGKRRLSRVTSVARRMGKQVANLPKLCGIRSSIRSNTPRMAVSISHAITNVRGIDISAIVRRLGRRLDNLRSNGVRCQKRVQSVLVGIPSVALRSLNKLIVQGNRGRFHLRRVTAVAYSRTPGRVFHHKRGHVDGMATGLSINCSLSGITSRVHFTIGSVSLPTGCLVAIANRRRVHRRSVGDLVFTLTLSIVLICVMLTSRFRSLLRPFAVLLAVPLTIMKTVLLFFLAKAAVGVVKIVNVIVLINVTIGGSVVLISHVGRLGRSNVRLASTVIRSNRRHVHPVLVAALAAVLTLLPVAFNFNRNTSLHSPVTVTIVNKLIASAIVDLVMVPYMCCMFRGVGERG